MVAGGGGSESAFVMLEVGTWKYQLGGGDY